MDQQLQDHPLVRRVLRHEGAPLADVAFEEHLEPETVRAIRRADGRWPPPPPKPAPAFDRFDRLMRSNRSLCG